jgi:hypothetical protein
VRGWVAAPDQKGLADRSSVAITLDNEVFVLSAAGHVRPVPDGTVTPASILVDR